MRRCVLSLVVFLLVGCAKPPAQEPPDLNLWPTVHQNDFTFGEGCVVRVHESPNACHFLQVKSGTCNKVHRFAVEWTWLKSKYPTFLLIDRRPSVTFVDSTRQINSFTIKTEAADQVSVCFDAAGPW